MIIHVTIHFINEDLFNNLFFTDDYMVPNAARIASIGTGRLVIKDSVTNNDESSARLNALNHIIAVIDESELLKDKEILMSSDAGDRPYSIGFKMGNAEANTICVILETELFPD